MLSAASSMTAEPSGDGEMVVAGSDFGAVGEGDWGVEFDDREILWCRRCGLGRANNIWHRESENQREDEL